MYNISQFGKPSDGNFTTQRVTIETSIQQRVEDNQVDTSGYNKTSHLQTQLKTHPPMRHVVKDVLVCVTRGPSPERKLHQEIYHLHSPSSADEQTSKTVEIVDVSSEHEVYLHSCMICYHWFFHCLYD